PMSEPRCCVQTSSEEAAAAGLGALFG
ncbi:hypothetical protein, partial [Methanobrevibacter sp.]